MIKNLLILAVALAAGYWYWSTQDKVDPQIAEQKKLEKNAQLMRECLTREQSMNAAAGLGGVGGIAVDAEELCAEKLGLFNAEGQWRELGIYDKADAWK